jgi:hypothetical protein
LALIEIERGHDVMGDWPFRFKQNYREIGILRGTVTALQQPCNIDRDEFVIRVCLLRVAYAAKGNLRVIQGGGGLSS